MDCDVRAALLSQYKLRLDEYQEAVYRLRKDGDAVVQFDFILLWKRAHRALIAYADAQRRLEQHIRQHGCWGSDHPRKAAVA